MLWPGTGRRVAVFVHRSSIIISPAVILLLLQLVHAALPPGAEDEIVLIEHLPGRRVHLQDFFWTGAEDAPPWLDPEQLLTLYETRTVHHTATVYIPEEQQPPQRVDGQSPRPIDCASCIEPTPTLPEQDIGVLVGEDPGPRYWLLTVIKAGEGVPPKVELRLARLYKAAFTRQQQRHLGLLGPEPPPRRARGKNFPKRQAGTENHTLPETTTDSFTLNETTTTTAIPDTSPQPPPRSSAVSLLHMRAVRIAKSKRTLPILASEEIEELAIETPHNEISQTNETKANLKSDVDVGLVQVRMQNMSVIDGGATRLIYTVHLGGKPVPAETAAKDMALLSAQEVALELGAPVLIQSEPYLKESRPLALSRKRDAWLLVGAAGAALLLVGIVVLGLLLLTKRKRAQSAVSAPPARIGGVLGKDEEYAPTTPGIDNTAYTSETEGRTEATSGQRLSHTPGSQETIVAADETEARGALSDVELEAGRGVPARPWDSREYADGAKKGAPTRRPQRGNTIDRPGSPDSIDSATGGGRLETLESLEKGFGAPQEATGSPHSYLSMPSCKQFPNMRSVEPLSKVLEPVVVKHLDLELDSPEMKIKDYDFMKDNGDHYFARASSDTKDPGVLGPIVWDLKRKRAVEGNTSCLGEMAHMESSGRSGPVGRARRRLNELLEDSFSLFGSRESKHGTREQLQQSKSTTYERRQPADGQGTLQDRVAVLIPESRGRSAHVSPVTSPSSTEYSRPRTSQQPRNGDQSIPETGNDVGPHPRGAWGSRPLSAGPFHRPNLPEVDVVRVLADAPLRPEDPAVPLIAAIKKELGKFTYD